MATIPEIANGEPLIGNPFTLRNGAPAPLNQTMCDLGEEVSCCGVINLDRQTSPEIRFCLRGSERASRLSRLTELMCRHVMRGGLEDCRCEVRSRPRRRALLAKSRRTTRALVWPDAPRARL